MHLPNGVTTIVDYCVGAKSLTASEFCNYSAITLAVGILSTVLGLVYTGLSAVLFCYKTDECEC